MIKAVLFDYGGVLTEGGKVGCVQRLFGRIYGIDPLKINDDRDILTRARLGTISQEEFFSEMNRRHPEGRRANRSNYMANADNFKKSEAVYSLAERLRLNRITTAILSNIFDIVADELRARGLYDGFDPVVLSCQEKLAKPDQRFYQIAIDRLHLRPEEILFIDDQAKNRQPAEALGMHFILATSPEQIVRDVEAAIYKQNGIKL